MTTAKRLATGHVHVYRRMRWVSLGLTPTTPPWGRGPEMAKCEACGSLERLENLVPQPPDMGRR